MQEKRKLRDKVFNSFFKKFKDVCLTWEIGSSNFATTSTSAKNHQVKTKALKALKKLTPTSDVQSLLLALVLVPLSPRESTAKLAFDMRVEVLFYVHILCLASSYSSKNPFNEVKTCYALLTLEIQVGSQFGFTVIPCVAKPDAGSPRRIDVYDTYVWYF